MIGYIIEDFPNYMIYEDGTVLNIEKGKYLTPMLKSNGYLYVELGNKGKRKNSYIHRLLARYFLSDYTPFLVVDHINQNKLDNRLVNLRMVTRAENTRLGNIGKPNNENQNRAARGNIRKAIASNKKEVEWIHDIYGSFKGSCSDLMIKFSFLNLTPSALSYTRRGIYTNHKGWRIV